jgi:outer membrane protein OmpA-like peptidoglycan-associated protein
MAAACMAPASPDPQPGPPLPLPPPPEPAPPVPVDRDHDGIDDRIDRCPDEPEDLDGFEDADGCPDPDNDHDRLPETRESPAVDTSAPIYFPANSARITPEMNPVLDAIAAKMRRYPFRWLEIQGYADLNEKNPESIAAQRAEAVRDALEQRGLSGGLKVKSFGTQRIVCAGAPCQAGNRRVEIAVYHMGSGEPSEPPRDLR